VSAASAFVRDLLPRALATTKAAFAEELASTMVLIVTLPDESGALATGLLQAFGGPHAAMRPTRDALFFATRTRMAEAQAARAPGMTLTPPTLAARLARGSHAIAPLRRRLETGRPHSDRIAVGRARNNDVVLRDDSISKFHAWFESDDQGGLYLADARSKNGTQLNGQPLTGADMEQVGVGDELTFGSVSTLLSSVDLLWEALRLR
jgi:hypothetical protein